MEYPYPTQFLNWGVGGRIPKIRVQEELGIRMVKSLDIGKFTISFGTNSRDCFGLGFEFYTESNAWLDGHIGHVEIPIARIIRFDFLIGFLNITRWINGLEFKEPYFN